MLKLIVFFVSFPLILNAQLTVNHIMQDPKWIGTSPSNIVWSFDDKSIYFQWNPEKNISDSAYQYVLSDNKTEKAFFNNEQLAEDISNGNYNHAKTQITFINNDDLYVLNISSHKITRLTQTGGGKSNALFINNDSDVVYTWNSNLFDYNLKTGFARQLTNFVNEAAPATDDDITKQQQWLNNEALQTSEAIKRRSDKADSAKAFINRTKEKELRKIYTGTNDVQPLTISPDGRFVTYVLYKRSSDAQRTMVPNYVTKNGYINELHSRPKVGRPEGDYAFYIFDRLKDTVINIATDSIAGIKDKPEFYKYYPQENNDSTHALRKVTFSDVYWNENATAAIVDIFSLDFKDRWIMQLNPSAGTLSLLDRQHDSAWIGGPGIGWLEPTVIGWTDNANIYFQSEVTGYSHLYSININTKQRKSITGGSYEIQKALISQNKKHFYIITNEEHPGRQNIYRINVDGTDKVKLTTFTGSYEMFLSPGETYLAYRYSYQTKPWELYYQALKSNAKPVQVTNKAMSDSFRAYPWRDTKIFTIPARDGAAVYARIYEPKQGKKNNAAVIFVHGAGYLQNITYGWSYYFREMMFNNLLADAGYTVLDIDYRASAGYGRNWRTGIYRYMGGKDLDDEVDAAHYLVHNLGIDSNRIGMYGGSYGGFITLMALFTQPDLFKAGAALRPVTDWAHYDHEYTAAILNEPFTDSIAYARSSPINFAAGLKNNLLICHGVVDVNVEFQDVVRLNQRLIELGKDNWQIAVYPVEDHSFVEASSWTDEYKRILKLFNDTLLK